MKKKYNTIKELLKDIIKKYNIEVFGGSDELKEWFKVKNLTPYDDNAGGTGLVVQKKGQKSKSSYTVRWFNNVRIKRLKK
jgi:hypothetical protein